MENCTVYSHYPEFDKVLAIIKAELPKATIEIKENGLQKSVLVLIKGGLFGKDKTLKINYRQRLNPSYKLDKAECDVTQNLAGMANFITSLPAQNEDIRGRLLYKVMATNSETAFIAEPDFKSGFENVLDKVIKALDAFVFVQPGQWFNKSATQYFADKNGDLIIDMEGNCGISNLDVNISTHYHDQPESEITKEQLDVKAVSEQYLESKGVKINKHLPCVEAASTVKIRTKEEIIERAYALLIITAKGDGISQEDIEREIEHKKIQEFSPMEKDLLYAAEPGEQEMANATWRYESLNAILWALGKTGELGYPDTICDVSAIIESIFSPSREAFEKSVSVKTAAQIIEELDKTYRMNWACVDARIKGQQVSGNLNPGVVYERHYALNWLINYQGQDWDNVQTNT